MKPRILLACLGAFGTILAMTGASLAQSVPATPFNSGNALRQGQEPPKPPVPPPAAVPVLPQPAEPPPLTLKGNEKLLVRHFSLDGPVLVDDAELKAIFSPYENQELTLAQIYEVADKVTTLYRNRGYFVAKAYVPAQDASGGELKIKIIIGQFGTVTLKNDSLVRDDHLQGVIADSRAGSAYVERDQLERAMLEINDLPGAGMPRVVIGAGQQPETSDFTFEVPEGRRVDGYILGDNFGPSFTGRNRLTAAVGLNSPLGYGDRLSGFGIVSERTDLQTGRAAYAFPIGDDGWRAELSAFRTTYVLTGAFGPLDATGNADAVAATLTYPLIRQSDHSLYISGYISHEWLNDKIFDASIADRTIDLGKIATTFNTAGAIASMPLTTSTTAAVTTGYVYFGDPTQKAENIAGADTVGNYAKLDLAFAATLALSEKLSLALNFQGQKSLSGNLDSSEQMTLTGSLGIRSYDEGLSGDSGYLVTPELKYALPEIFGYKHSIGLFTDIGAAVLENASFTTTQKAYTQLNDIGLGYDGTYEYSPGRFALLKAEIAHTYGSEDGAHLYNRGTKALLQVGFTF